jgi:hypothetical protein
MSDLTDSFRGPYSSRPAPASHHSAAATSSSSAAAAAANTSASNGGAHHYHHHQHHLSQSSSRSYGDGHLSPVGEYGRASVRATPSSGAAAATTSTTGTSTSNSTNEHTRVTLRATTSGTAPSGLDRKPVLAPPPSASPYMSTPAAASSRAPHATGNTGMRLNGGAAGSATHGILRNKGEYNGSASIIDSESVPLSSSASSRRQHHSHHHHQSSSSSSNTNTNAHANSNPTHSSESEYIQTLQQQIYYLEEELTFLREVCMLD